MQHLPPVRLRQIATILIRVFTIQFAFYTFSYFLETALLYRGEGSHWAALALMGVWVIAMWGFSPLIARCITFNQDAAFEASVLTLRDLYRFAFLLVGLYYAIAPVGPLVTEFVAVLHPDTLDRPILGTLITTPLLQNGIRVLLGVALLIYGSRLADMLIKRQDEAADPPPEA
ncbi:MAG: hypothetical protein K8S99_17325 [Planctomycetes bacterium]|nr:hypothetical protein [Planctomycetota bacterium]